MADFYADHNVAQNVVRMLNYLGHNARSARELHETRLHDEEHLLLAAERNWILITYDRDFIMLDRAWHRWATAWQSPASHAGILLMPQQMNAIEIAHTIDRLIASSAVVSNRLLEWQVSGSWA